MMNFFEFCRTGGLDRFSGRSGMMDRFGRMGYMGFGGWLIGLLIAALVVVGIVFLIRAIVRSSAKSSGVPSSHVIQDPSNFANQVPPSFAALNNPALKILDERFARGEIDSEEYRRRKDELLRP